MNQLETAAYKLLSQRQRINDTTDITQFTRYVQGVVPDTTEQDVIEFFKGLQTQGVGTVVRGRKDNPNRFLWSYNLKEVAERALGLRTEVSKLNDTKPKAKTVKAKVGRPAKSKFKVVRAKAVKATGLSINISLPASVRPEDLQALIELANGLKK